MKKIILPVLLTICIALCSVLVFAQKRKIEKKETREIIIRNNGDKNTKMKIEIDGDNVTVNGKPLSEYHNDDVTIIKRDRMNRGLDNLLFSPGEENMDFDMFNENSKSSASKTFLGVVTEKSTDGVKINQVMKGSSAEKAGLQNGDVITKIDNKNINTPGELMEVVQSYKPNDEVRIYYKRDSKKNDVKIKLGETKESKRTFIFNDDNNFKNRNDFNFKMQKMPKMPDFPNAFKHWNMNNVKLGVKIEDTQDNSGAKIMSIEEGSAADKAGLKKDDIITEMNGEKVANVDDVRSELMDAENKENYKLKAKRNNTEMTFELKIPKHVNSADL